MPTRVDIRQRFGARLRELRTRAHLTQQRLGEAADVNYKFVGAIERGEENPSLLVIDRLAHALGVAPAELFDVQQHESADAIRARLKKMVDAVPTGDSGASDELRLLFRVVHAVVGVERTTPEGKRQR